MAHIHSFRSFSYFFLVPATKVHYSLLIRCKKEEKLEKSR